MSMILDEDGYERMRAHQRAASRAAVSRADENERLRERIKELEAEVKRWKPRPMSSAPKDGSLFWAVYRLGTSLGFVQSWHVSAVVQMDSEGVIRKPDGEPLFMDFVCWYDGLTEDEFKTLEGTP